MSFPSTLYRYTELKWASSFVEKGIISFGSAAAYDDSKLSEAQQDNEQRRELNLRPQKYGLIVADNKEAHGFKNIIKLGLSYGIVSQGEYLRYHILCLSYTANSRFYADFPESDCMITFHNPEEFSNRLAKALVDQLPDYGGQSSSIFYYDPNELFLPRSNLDLCFCKNKTIYSWQTEYRVALFGPIEKATNNRLSLILGDLQDICSISKRP